MSWAIWITGPPASGKSVLAREVEARLRAMGEPVTVLELDLIRRTVTPEPRYTDAEREIVYRLLVFVARLLTGAGVPVIIDATAHRRAWRELAREAIPVFAEVQLVCPLPVLVERERTRRTGHAPRGIYAAAGRPGATVPGVDVAYEPALAPELLIDTSREDVAESAARVVELARRLARQAPALARPAGRGWAMWITGRPGSGKTTIACAVAERLRADGVDVCVLDLADLRDFVLGGRHLAADEDEMLHRGLVAAARAATDAGVNTIIDATAPRRAWRAMAREAIACFAEIQLACPPEVCGERERALRWNLAGRVQSAPRPRAAQEPEIALDYEAALDPDLTLHTDVQSPDSAAEDVLRLARRLLRTVQRMS